MWMWCVAALWWPAVLPTAWGAHCCAEAAAAAVVSTRCHPLQSTLNTQQASQLVYVVRFGFRFIRNFLVHLKKMHSLSLTHLPVVLSAQRQRWHPSGLALTTNTTNTSCFILMEAFTFCTLIQIDLHHLIEVL